MSVKLPAALANLPRLIAAGLISLPARCREWGAAVRDDPGCLWRSPRARVAGLILLIGVLVLVAAIWFFAGSSAPSGRRTMRTLMSLPPQRVACANPACRLSYTAPPPAAGKSWPLLCKQCGQASVYPATACPSCRAWYAAVPDRPAGCPFCAPRKPAEPLKPPERERPASPDSEDHW